jgi:hypothetical protein
MKNLHLIPVNVLDLVEKLNDSTIKENEHLNYQLRLEAIRDYCSVALNKHSAKKPVIKSTTRVYR